MNRADDDAVYIQLLEGSEKAFAVIYQRYADPLFRYVYRFVPSSEGAEDILHDVFLELLAGKYQAHAGGTLKSWLYTVAKNKSLNASKKAGRDVLGDIENIQSAHCLEEQTIDRNLHQHLAKAEDLLPQDLKKTWQLKKQGLDHRAISLSLDIPLGTVKSRFHRIVEILRKEFHEV